jgi:hypothetical protein
VTELAAENKYAPREIASYFADDEWEMIQQLRKLAQATHRLNYEVAMRLVRVKDEELWKKAEYCTVEEEYTSFNEWVFHELGFSSGKARYLQRIARKVIELRLTPPEVARLMNLGWSKAANLLRADSTQHLDELYERCRYMSERELIHTVRIEIEEEEGDEEDYLEKPVTIAAQFRRRSQYKFMAQALAVIEKKHGTKTTAQAMSLLAASYIATSLPGGEEANAKELDIKLRALEEQYNVRLDVVIPEEGVGVHDKSGSEVPT